MRNKWGRLGEGNEDERDVKKNLNIMRHGIRDRPRGTQGGGKRRRAGRGGREKTDLWKGTKGRGCERERKRRKTQTREGESELKVTAEGEG